MARTYVRKQTFCVFQFFFLIFQIRRDSVERPKKSFFLIWKTLQPLTSFQNHIMPVTGLKVYVVIWFKQKIYTKEVKLTSSLSLRLSQERAKMLIFNFCYKTKSQPNDSRWRQIVLVLTQDNRTEACLARYSKVNIFCCNFRMGRGV